MARISYVDPQQAGPYIRDVFQKMEAQKQPIVNVFRIVAHDECVGRNFLRLGNAILSDDVLAPKLRELAILRVGYLCGSFYEYTKHVGIGMLKGVSQQQIDDLPYWGSSDKFDRLERAVLAYTDEVTSLVQVRDETFAALETFLNEEQIVKLTATIGYYCMVCRILVPLQVELDPGETSLLPGVDKY